MKEPYGFMVRGPSVPSPSWYLNMFSDTGSFLSIALTRVPMEHFVFLSQCRCKSDLMSSSSSCSGLWLIPYFFLIIPWQKLVDWAWIHLASATWHVGWNPSLFVCLLLTSPRGSNGRQGIAKHKNKRECASLPNTRSKTPKVYKLLCSGVGCRTHMCYHEWEWASSQRVLRECEMVRPHELFVQHNVPKPYFFARSRLID